jgi:nucleoside-diphosphate-sugar epimerase
MIFVTGGTGLLGAHLLYKLTSSNHEVLALKRENSNLERVKTIFSGYTDNVDELFNKITWIDGDLLDYSTITECVEKADYVFHTAAMVSLYRKDWNRLMKINIEGTANIVNACLNAPDKKLCYVSSIGALAEKNHGELITEEDFLDSTKDKSRYSISKFKAEMEVWRGISEGLKAVIVNPSFIIGCGDWSKSSANMFRLVHEGVSFYTPGSIGCVDVRDVADIIIKLTFSDISGERYIINSENVNYKYLLVEISKLFGIKSPRFLAGKGLLTIAQKYDWVLSLFTSKPPRLTKEVISSLVSKCNYSNEKIKKELNYDFIPVAESLKHTASLFLKELNSQ